MLRRNAIATLAAAFVPARSETPKSLPAPLAGAPATIKVRLKLAAGQATIDLPLESYVSAVLAAESRSFRSDEAMKAMAVAIRTYAIHFRGRHSAAGYDLCTTTHCQRLDFESLTPRLKALGSQTAGELLWFEGKPVFACYSRSCGGTTESAAAVWSVLGAPFLRSLSDPYCTRQPVPVWHWGATPPEIAAVLQRSQLPVPPELAGITVAQRTPSGRARVLLLAGDGPPVRVRASSFRIVIGRALGWKTVRSDRFEIGAAAGRLTFQGSGEGHGVGLCQLGAHQMGLEGHGYREILAFYYPGTSLGQTVRNLP